MPSSCFTLCFEKVIPSHTNDMRKNCLSAKYCKENTTGWLFQPLECCCFNIEKKMILREFSDRNDLTIYDLTIDLHDTYSFIALLLITLRFHCWLCLIQNDWSTRLENKTKQKKTKNKKTKKERKGNIKCFSMLSRPWRNL